MSQPQQASAIWSHPDFQPLWIALRPVVIALAVTSGLMNVLMLTSPLFMLQVYDRVLPSHSMPTLIGLLVLATVLTGFLGLLEVLRARILTRIGLYIDQVLTTRVFSLLLQREQRAGPRNNGDQCVRDLDTLRGFASGGALTALFDLPWMTIYVAICFMFHPLMGWAVLAGVVLLCGLAFVTEMMLREPTERAFEVATSRRAFADTMKRNAGLLQALGMHGVMGAQWSEASLRCRSEQARSADIAGVFGAIMRAVRMLLQAALLAIGAYLVIKHEASAGVMLAATILTVRALSPVELLIANWKSFIAVRQSFGRLAAELNRAPPDSDRTPLPPPSRSLSVSGISLLAAGRDAPVLHNVSFTLQAGSALGVIGASGSGKSSLARTLVGLWPPARGVLRLDGAEPDQWGIDALGRSIGYLPQDIELLPGTIAQNISRFQPDDPTKLFAAAEQAAVHDMIVRLPNGYDTQVGEGGTLLSGGQRQRIALARALYDDPFLVILDEPNSNLDSEGENALTQAIAGVRARGGIAIVIAHRPSALNAVNKLLVLSDGVPTAFGERDEVLRKLSPPQPARAATAPRVVPNQAAGAAHAVAAE